MDAPIKPPLSPAQRNARLRELATLFLRLGTTAFGGPAAHIAMFEDEVVRKRHWLSHTDFLDLLAMTNFIPGPNSTEMAIHVGYLRAGWRGLIVAGVSFIVPAAVMVTAIAWLYTLWGTLPVTGAVLYGVKPVVIAIIAIALWRLGKTCLKTWPLAILAAIAAGANALGLNELIVLAAAGVLVGAGRGLLRPRSLPMLAALPLGATTTAGAAVAAGLWPLFLVFLKIGSVLFGSGYVLLAFLRADLVNRLGWLTEGQLLDATAVGQVTPGPVFTTATFIGYIIGARHGWPLAGALVATVGIFLPAFVFVALSGPFLPRLRKSPLAAAFLDGLNVASLALMAVVTVQLARAALLTPALRPDFVALTLAVASLVLLLRKLNATWLLLAGAIAGMLALWLRGNVP